MSRFDISTYQATIHHKQEHYDDGPYNGANEPSRNLGVNDMSTNFKSVAIGGLAFRTSQSVSNNIRQTISRTTGRADIDARMQNADKLRRFGTATLLGGKMGGPFGAGLAATSQIIIEGASEISRIRLANLENISREDERKLHGSKINNNQFKGAYYD